MPSRDPAKRRAYDLAWSREHPERRRAIRTKHFRTAQAHAKLREADFRVKVETLQAYSEQGGILCRQCGFGNIYALHLDHIEENGAADRLARTGRARRAGVQFFRLLRRAGFPPGYQVLCSNCNLIKHAKHREAAWQRKWSDKPAR